jgi:NAD(P)-dependent dehydrogenase (short-subunit alcohol dehydrogenase family)
LTGFLQGQVALVTGASRGIGAATAEALGREGAHVVLTARTAGGLEEVEIASTAPRQRDHRAAGPRRKRKHRRLAAAMSERWQALDILVLNAAMLGSLSPVPHIDSKELGKLLTLNLLAPQALVAAFDPMLRSSERGRVLAITSSVGTRPRAFWGAYGASKGR